jgi:hypothetical protein
MFNSYKVNPAMTRRPAGQAADADPFATTPAAPTTPTPAASTGYGLYQPPLPAPLWWTLVSASIALSTFHGIKRHRGSIPWGLGWGLLGGLFPIVVPAIAIAQGLGTPIKKGE